MGDTVMQEGLLTAKKKISPGAPAPKGHGLNCPQSSYVCLTSLFITYTNVKLIPKLCFS